MDLIPKNLRFINGVKWLIRVRWYAIVWVASAVIIAKHYFKVDVHDRAFYAICFALICENVFSLIVIKSLVRNRNENIAKYITYIINIQIALDLFFLMILMHFSGGIENPIYIFSIFHMVISSILISNAGSYIHTTFALTLLWLIAFLEYFGTIPHFNLWVGRNTDYLVYKDLNFIIENLTIFTISAYLLVYMTNYIVSLLHKQQEAYKEANILLEKQDAIKNEYLQRVTHNIKGHLSAILTNLAIVRDNKYSSTINKDEFTDIAYSRTFKLTEFVNSLLQLTEMKLKEEPETEEFVLSETIDNAISLIRNEANLKSIQIISIIDTNIDKIVSNKVSIDEMITSLLQNAIKYTPQNGKVEINVKEEDGCVFIIISDTGIGIPKDEIPRVFDEFYRATNAREYIKDGTGLGLATSKYIAQRYGGKIWVESEERIGTSFYIKLPKEYPAKCDN